MRHEARHPGGGARTSARPASKAITAPAARVFVTWMPAHTRSASLAKHLGAEDLYIYPIRDRRFRYLLAPFKYFLAARETLRELHHRQPAEVFVMNPPIFAPLVVWLYCRATGARFVIDTHTAAFDRPRWRAFSWLHRFLARRAVVNLLHNRPLADRVAAAWDVPTLALGNVPYVMADVAPADFHESPGPFNVVVIATFDVDEPIMAIIEATNHVPDCMFYVTGRIQHAPAAAVRAAGPNVRFTDFLSAIAYAALLRACDAVICLTLNDLTMQNGAYEALALGKPVITSDWPVLRQAFPKGALLVDNTAFEIARAVRRLRDEHRRYVREIEELRAENEVSWRFAYSFLLDALS